MHFEFNTTNTCSKKIEFDLEGEVVKNVSFIGGCNGNLKAVSKLVDGMTVEQIEAKLKGNTCGGRSTSCADQLCVGIRKALDESKNA